MQVFKIDENGYYVSPIIIGKDEEIPSNCIEVQPPNGLYRARWINGEWVEDMTQEEIDELVNRPKERSEIDYILDLDYRLSKIELGL